MLNFIKNILKLENKKSEVFIGNTFRDIMSISYTKEQKTLMRKFVSDNIKYIKNINEDINEDIFDEFQEIVFTGIIRGSSCKTLGQELQRKFLLDKKSADLIARDQIQKAHSDLTRLRHRELGITEYKWLTGRDERVRPSHRVLEGKICSYDDVNVYKNNAEDKDWLQKSTIGGALYHPGQEVLCRCTEIAIVKF